MALGLASGHHGSPHSSPDSPLLQKEKGWSLVRQACSQAGAYIRDRAHAIGCHLSSPFAESGAGNLMLAPAPMANVVAAPSSAPQRLAR